MLKKFSLEYNKNSFKKCFIYSKKYFKNYLFYYQMTIQKLYHL